MRFRNRCIWLALLAACSLCPELNTSSPAQTSPLASPLTAKSLNAILDRQMQAWQKQDFSLAAGDWLPEGKLISPGGEVTASEMQAVIVDYAKHFRDLHVTIQRAILSQDGKTATIVWDWDVTRIRDGKRGVTHDAIIVDFEGGKIKTWHEYFDLGNSVDANP